MTRTLKTLDDVMKARLCHGCGACAAFAPDAVKMRETQDENLRPHKIKPLSPNIEPAIVRACPGANPASKTKPKSLHESTWGPVLEVWEGYASDHAIRHKGSSGGAVTALALFAVEKADFHGALHVKARKDNPTLNEAAISTNRAELMEGSGSRYAPASIGDKLRNITKYTKSSVVIGKPCDISGANMAAKVIPELGEKIGLTIAIFCAGAPSHEGTKALTDYLSPSDKKAALKSLDYRGEGWPGDMRALWQTKSGDEKHTTSYAHGWGEILQKHRQWRCHTCADHTGEQADISVGDPWQTPTTDDEHGKSLIIIRTRRGQEFMRKVKAAGYLKLERKDPDILFTAQPNLFTTKGAVWGRSMAMKLAGLKAPTLGRDSFNCWLKLPLKIKIQSFAGTFKRIIRKKLYRAKTVHWVPRG